MRVLLIGASGTLGGAIKNLLEEKGHEVISATRSTQPAIDIATPSSIDAFYASAGKFDAIVCAAGDAAFKALETLSDDDVILSVSSKLSGQVNIVRKGISNLNPGGVFVITGGTLAYTPWPHTSLITMVNLGLEGFAKGAALDLKEGKRIMIVHPPFVKETAAMFGMDTSPWPDAKEAAKAYLESLESKMSGEPVFVAGHKPV